MITQPTVMPEVSQSLTAEVTLGEALGYGLLGIGAAYVIASGVGFVRKKLGELF